MSLPHPAIHQKHEAEERVASWLAHSCLLAGMSPSSIGQIAKQSVALYVPAQAEVFKAGTQPNGFFVVVFGSMALYLQGADHAERLSEIVGPGECFGEVAFLLDQPYPVSSRALTDCLVIRAAAEPVYQLLASDPSFARQLLASLAMRLQRLMKDIRSFAFNDAGGRLAGYLLELRHGADSSAVRLPMTKGALASKLLLAPETLSRLLKSWVACGAISMKGRTLQILDEHFLVMQANSDVH